MIDEQSARLAILLEALHGTERSERQRAAKLLSSRLQTLARKACRTKARVVATDDQVEDVVQSVLYTVLQESPATAVLRRTPTLAGDPDALEKRLAAYLRAMLYHCFIDLLEQCGRVVLRDDLASDKVGPEGHPGPTRDVVEVIERSREILARVVAAELVARDSRHRVGLERAWSQIQELCFEQGVFDRLLERDEGIGPESPRGERAAARNRVYKAHERARVSILQRAELMLEAGELTGEEQAIAAGAATYLLRRRQISGAGVSEEETP